MAKNKSTAKLEATESITHTPTEKAKLATMPSVNAATVIHAYQGNIAGKDVDMSELVFNLQETFKASKEGDLSRLENMLIGQATALQTIFTSLARRAQQQEYQKHFESFLVLALKAQAQSRSTIQAVVDLKYPRQVSFVKQANISLGHQQVNNAPKCGDTTQADFRGEKSESLQDKLLEDANCERTEMDTRAARAAGRSDKKVEALGTLNRTHIDRR